MKHKSAYFADTHFLKHEKQTRMFHMKHRNMDTARKKDDIFVKLKNVSMIWLQRSSDYGTIFSSTSLMLWARTIRRIT